jgi:hypothetical protein
VELFRLETRGLDTTTLKWGEQASPDPTKGDIIASIAGNFRNYSGSLTAQGPAQPAQGDAVFDSLTNAERLSGGFILPGFKHAGEIVTLEGAARLVTRLDVAIQEFSTLVGSMDFKLNLWTADDLPGELIWSSPVQHAEGLTRDLRIVSVDVPHVEVPNRFGWTIEKISTTFSPGIPGFPSPSIGSVEASWWENEPSGWQSILGGDGAFGFRVIAVPEPATSLLLLAGISVLLVQSKSLGPPMTNSSSCGVKCAARDSQWRTS